MANESSWKSGLGATERFENIQKIQTCMITAGKSSKGAAQKDAFLAETAAYEAAMTREEYYAACEALATTEDANIVVSLPESGITHALQDPAAESTQGTAIGKYEACQYVASGICSEVYRCKNVALKVITETRNIEPHNSTREVQILKSISQSEIIQLRGTFQDSHQRLVLEFDYLPFNLATILASEAPFQPVSTHTIAAAIFSALSYLHEQKIIHRDIKPSNVLLGTATPNPADNSTIKLCDFGTAWHPTYSAADEPSSDKVLEVGTTCYRAPETLFGNRAYGPSLDIWSTGCLLVECLRQPHAAVVTGTSRARRREPPPLFESRSTEEDGNQLGLILSMFKTLGTPTAQTWPEAAAWRTNPFGFWNVFEGRPWAAVLQDAGGEESWGGRLVRRCLRFESSQRITADEALRFLTENGP